jgi:AcrR family transcriptional regulator
MYIACEMSRKAVSNSKMGRPTGFSTEKALEAAMRVFWHKGFEGASLTDLTRAMGINRSSMYAAFGDKEALYQKALKRYTDGPMGWVESALQKPTARESIRALLEGSVTFLSDPTHPRCCFSVQGLATGDEGDNVRLSMIDWRKGFEKAVLQRLQRARNEGDLPASVNTADLAKYICTVWTGLAVQAASGASRWELTRIIQLALKTIP